MSSIGDYIAFAEMLRRGGHGPGSVVLGPRTLELMTSNHLPGGHDMAHFGHNVNPELTVGVGFGLGFFVVLDPVAMRLPASRGQFGWSGAASTTFFVDPAEDLSVVFCTQVMPSSASPVRRELRVLVHQALLD